MKHSTDYMRCGRFACQDCGHDVKQMGEMFMLKDDLWIHLVHGCEQGWANMLCVGCVEERLGRKLKPWDFTNAPLNFLSPRSLRLRNRLRGREFQPGLIPDLPRM